MTDNANVLSNSIPPYPEQTTMKTRTMLSTALTLALALSAPLAFAQDAATPAQGAPMQDQQATDAAQPATDAATAAPQQSAQPAQPAGEAKQITWSDLDGDKDGKLTKAEASSVQALTQVFDDADADKDGALTPDEYKAFVANNQGKAAAGSEG